MASADELLDQILSWIEKREHCANQLRKLAQELELESLIKNCTARKCVGNSVRVVGAACLIGARVATFFTGRAAAPLVGLAAISLTTTVTKSFLSSNPMKEAQKIDKESNEPAERIQQLFEKLKDEMKKVNPEPEELDQHIGTEILRAMARRSGLEINFNYCNDMPQFFTGVGQTFAPRSFSPDMSSLAFIIRALIFNKGVQHLIKEISKGGVLIGGAMVTGRVVGMMFALPEAIDNWKEMIKNNHVTKASPSLRDAANTIQETTQVLREQFNNADSSEKKGTSDSQGGQRHKHQQQQEDRHTKESNSNIKRGQNVQWGSGGGGGGGGDREGRGNRGDKECGEDKESDDDSNSDEESEYDESSDEATQNGSATVRIILINVQSLNNKIRHLHDLMRENNADICLPTETWLNSDNANEILSEASPPNYSSIQQPRDGRGGGVAIMFSPAFQGVEIRFDFITTFEYVAAVLQHNEWDEHVLFINVYRTTRNRRFGTFLQEFHRLLIETHWYSNIIVTGDFNIWVDDERQSITRRFNVVLEVAGFDQHVTGATHRQGHTLDLVITRNVEISNVIIRNDDISDHYTVYFRGRPKAKKDQDEQDKQLRKKEE